jgi:tryptophan synthase alpha chain
MAGRIAKTFEALRRDNRSGFIAYVTAGDPSPGDLPEILAALDAARVDIIELGIPFSDPLADGPTIQAASGRALAAGMTVPKVIEAVRAFRRTSGTPVVFFTYLNPVHAFGFGRFAAAAAEAGADGLLVLDLPPEEAAHHGEFVTDGGLDPIRLVAPTTSLARMAAICRGARGFIYYVSREGVTGEQNELAAGIGPQVAALRRVTDLPIAVGFGISTPQQAAEVARDADAVVVGSAIVRRIAAHGAAAGLGRAVGKFVAPLVEAAHTARDTG